MYYNVVFCVIVLGFNASVCNIVTVLIIEW